MLSFSMLAFQQKGYNVVVLTVSRRKLYTTLKLWLSIETLGARKKCVDCLFDFKSCRVWIIPGAILDFMQIANRGKFNRNYTGKGRIKRDKERYFNSNGGPNEKGTRKSNTIFQKMQKEQPEWGGECLEFLICYTIALLYAKYIGILVSLLWITFAMSLN